MCNAQLKLFMDKGNWAEYLMCIGHKGYTKAPERTEGYDLINDVGHRIQVKARRDKVGQVIDLVKNPDGFDEIILVFMDDDKTYHGHIYISNEEFKSKMKSKNLHGRHVGYIMSITKELRDRERSYVS